MEGPIRTCLACRARGAQDSLVRLAVHDGTVTAMPPGRAARRRPDVRPPGARAPRAARPAPQPTGRGAYLCPRPGCAEAGLRRDAAAVLRALRLRPGDVAVDADAIRAAVASAGAGNEMSAQKAAPTAASGRAAAARGVCT